MNVCCIPCFSRRVVAALLLAPLFFTAAAAKAADAGEDAAIAPYLDEGTFFVMRLDVDRVEPAAVEKMMNDVMVARVDNPAFPEDVRKRIQEQAKEEIETTKTWLADMTAAGGKRLYVLVDQADQNGPGDGPMLVVPLTAGADK